MIIDMTKGFSIHSSDLLNESNPASYSGILININHHAKMLSVKLRINFLNKNQAPKLINFQHLGAIKI